MDSSDGLLMLIGIYLLSRFEGFERILPGVVDPSRPAPARARGGALNSVPEPLLQKARDNFPGSGGTWLYDLLHGSPNKDLPGSQLTRQAVLSIAKNAGFPDPKLAAAIAFAESGGVPRVVKRSSKETSVGLWQINIKKHTRYSESDMRDPIKNARAAFQISKGGKDWSPWTMYRNGTYRQFQTGLFEP